MKPIKFSGSVDINKPRDIVVILFQDPANLKEYQDGFDRKEVMKGKPGKEGTVSKMYYKSDRLDMELTETILKNSLPDEFLAEYHHKHMDNTMLCKFIALDENTTRYEYEFEYTRISWVIPRLMFILFPGKFREQGEKWMTQFKEFVER